MTYEKKLKEFVDSWYNYDNPLDPSWIDIETIKRWILNDEASWDEETRDFFSCIGLGEFAEDVMNDTLKLIQEDIRDWQAPRYDRKAKLYYIDRKENTSRPKYWFETRKEAMKFIRDCKKGYGPILS